MTSSPLTMYAFALLLPLVVGCARAAEVPPPPKPPQPLAVSDPGPSGPPPPRDACERSIASALSSLQEQSQVELVPPSGVAEGSEYVVRLEQSLQRLVELSGGNVVMSVPEVQPGEPQPLKDAISSKRCGLHGTAGGICVALSYRGHRGLTFNGLQRPVGAFHATIPQVIMALRDEARERRERIGVADKGGVSFDEQAMLPATKQTPGNHHGPRAMSLDDYLKQTRPSREHVTVDVSHPIDPTLAGLVLTQAAQTWTDVEMRHVDDFLMRGDKSLIVIAGAANIAADDTTMSVSLSTHGIDRLLRPYGFELTNTLVEDRHPLHLHVFDPVTKDRPPWKFPGFVVGKKSLGTIDESFAPFKLVQQVMFPYPSPLRVHPDKQPDAELRSLAHAADGVLSTSPPAGMRPTNASVATQTLPSASSPSVDAAAPVPVAAVLEGQLRSAFGDRKAPARLAVFSSPYVLFNPFARAYNRNPAEQALLHEAGAYAYPFVSQWTLMVLLGDWVLDELHPCRKQWRAFNSR